MVTPFYCCACTGGGAADGVPPEDHRRGKKRLRGGDDEELNLLFWLFRHKGLTPGAVYAMAPGERDVLLAFALWEIELEKE